jgi:hypothetical protein
MADLHRRQHVRLRSWIRRGASLAALSLGLIPVVGSAQQGPPPAIVVNPGRHGPYYHMRFDLVASGIDFSQSDRSAGPGGQFTVRLRPEHFPVPAPSCRGDLILRMPWTSPSLPDANLKIAAKMALQERILKLEHTPDAAVPVVLELNPYVQMVSRAPLLLRLTQCNVFFRQVLGAYVGDTEARQDR